VSQPELVEPSGRWLSLSAAAQALGVSERTLQRRGLRKRPGPHGTVEVFVADPDTGGQLPPVADTSDTLARFSEGLADALVRRDARFEELIRENERLRAEVTALRAGLPAPEENREMTDGGQRLTGWRRWWAWLTVADDG
jgi:hypothetical protein